MHSALRQDTQESLKCLNKHIPHQFEKERERELVQPKDKHSLLSLSNGQACSRPFPEAWADRNTAFQPNGPQAPAFVC